jgi:hypothetical protein
MDLTDLIKINSDSIGPHTVSVDQFLSDVVKQ